MYRMQNRMQEDSGNIFGADGWQYDSEVDGCEQGPATHIVGGSGEGSGLGLHVYKIDSDIAKNAVTIASCVSIYVSFLIQISAR